MISYPVLPSPKLNDSLKPCSCGSNREYSDIIIAKDNYWCGKCEWNLGDVKYEEPERSYRGYDVRHHISHTLRRMQCIEHNKPYPELIEGIKKMLDNLRLSYSKTNIKKCLRSVADKKHLIYVWCTLNDIPFLEIGDDHKELIFDKITNEEVSGDKMRRNNFQNTISKLIDKNVKELEYIKKYLSKDF